MYGRCTRLRVPAAHLFSLQPSPGASFGNIYLEPKLGETAPVPWPFPREA